MTMNEAGPKLEERAERAIKASIYRAALRAILGEPEPAADPEAKLLAAFEWLLLARRARAAGFEHTGRLFERQATVTGETKLALGMLVRQTTEAAPKLPPEKEAKRG